MSQQLPLSYLLANLKTINPIDKISNAIEMMPGFINKDKRKKIKELDFKKAFGLSADNLGEDKKSKNLSTAATAGLGLIAHLTGLAVPYYAYLAAAGLGSYAGKQSDIKDAEAPLEKYIKDWGDPNAFKALKDFKESKGGLALSTGFSDAFLEWIMPSEFGFDALNMKDWGDGGFKKFMKDFGKEKVKDKAGNETKEVTFNKLVEDFSNVGTLGLAPTTGSKYRKSPIAEFAKIPAPTQSQIESIMGDKVQMLDIFKSKAPLMSSLSNQLAIGDEEWQKLIKESPDFVDSIIQKAMDTGFIPEVDLAEKTVGEATDKALKNILDVGIVKDYAQEGIRKAAITNQPEWLRKYIPDYATMPGGEGDRFGDFIKGKFKIDDDDKLVNSLLAPFNYGLANPVISRSLKQNLIKLL